MGTPASLNCVLNERIRKECSIFKVNLRIYLLRRLNHKPSVTNVGELPFGCLLETP